MPATKRRDHRHKTKTESIMSLADTPSLAPPSPKSLEEVGLPAVMMREIALKTLFRGNISLVSDLARALCLPVTLAQDLVDEARRDGLIEAMGTLNGGGAIEMPYQLTETGKTRALSALKQSEYFGPMPVPLESFATQVERQSIRNLQITRAQLTEAMGDLILPDRLIGDLGPAVGAGRSILLYGPPGNGKSAISNGIRNAMGDRIYLPHAVAHRGQAIMVYDPIVHEAVTPPSQTVSALRRIDRFDRRYVLCRRPSVVTGGELSLKMLDLVYDQTARTYQAPLQMKATGGIFIVDDLGRQTESPQALVNRWIVPLEERRDILALQSGEKFEVPFDTLVVFSTNFHPNEIFDQAALRRIFFKIKVDGPDEKGFLQIFAKAAQKRGLQLDETSLVHLLRTHYPKIGSVFANYQPGYLIEQMIAVCDFEGLPYRMTPELVDRAWGNMFVRDEKIAK
jgi:hypothetical protein